MKKQYDALVGLSVNPEANFPYSDTLDGKALASSVRYYLSGSSANIALALMRLGHKPRLLGLTSTSNGEAHNHINNDILEKLLQTSNLPFTHVNALDKTNFAFVPLGPKAEHNKVIGLKGTVQSHLIDSACATIREENGLWRVGSGVRPAEVPFIETLYENAEEGYRTLTPKPDLIENTVLFKKVLKSVDLLVMNAKEFQACGLNTPNEMHSLGPKMIVVTDEANGGRWSYQYRSSSWVGTYQSHDYPGYIASRVGAGDWFHAALIAHGLHIQKSVLQLNKESIEQALYFAAHVSGKKITMLGGSNGPSRDDLLITF